MAFHTWLSFALLSMAFCMIPGPSVCFTVGYALEQGFGNALASIAGQLGSNGLYILAASLGLGRLVDASGWSLTVLRLSGSAYILYLGLARWRAGPMRLEGAGGGRTAGDGALRGFGKGFAVCATNPKTILYYAAVLPPFISPEHDPGFQLAVLSATGVAAGGLALLLYALLAGRVRDWLARDDRLHLKNRIAGGLMIVAAAYLALGC